MDDIPVPWYDRWLLPIGLAAIVGFGVAVLTWQLLPVNLRMMCVEVGMR